MCAKRSVKIKNRTAFPIRAGCTFAGHQKVLGHALKENFF